jgi:hypothetical protein
MAPFISGRVSLYSPRTPSQDPTPKPPVSGQAQSTDAFGPCWKVDTQIVGYSTTPLNHSHDAAFRG